MNIMKFLRDIIHIAKQKLNLCIDNNPPPPFSSSSVELDGDSSLQTNFSAETGLNSNDVNHATMMLNQRREHDSPPPPSSSFPVELAGNSSLQTSFDAEAGLNSNEGDHGATMSMQWRPFLELIGVLVQAFGAVLQALQVTGPLPLRSQLVYVAQLTSFTAVVTSTCIRKNYRRVSDVLLHVGVFFAAAALVVALVSNLQTPLMVTSIAIILSGIFIFIIACLSKPAT